MTAATLTLTDFLLARIAEDEVVARKIPHDGAGWFVEPSPTHPDEWLVDSNPTLICYSSPARDVQEHIARHDPVRVLAECEAKRQIVEAGGSECGERHWKRTDPDGWAEHVARMAEVGIRPAAHWPDDYATACDGCAAAQSADHDHEWTLQVLATAYADHPDYRDEWRP